AALLGGAASASVLVALASGASDPKSQVQPAVASLVPQPLLGANGTPVCAPFGVPLLSSSRWFYLVHRNSNVHAVLPIYLARIDDGRVEFLTAIDLGEDRVGWSSLIDCASGEIIQQEAADLAYGYWPFPGVFVGQRLDASEATDFHSAFPRRRRGESARAV